ncbi:hypothetical protein FQN55_006993 [Onygenales sp. PD_40]|nr:hypothetical protein FQN55_006993 [Onygenales sp. PD_40]
MRSPFKDTLTCAVALLSTAQAQIRPWKAYHGLLQADFEETVNALEADGYTPYKLDAFNLNDEVRFGGIWVQTWEEHVEYGFQLNAKQHNKTFTPFITTHLPKLGPRWLTGYTDAEGEAQFASIWTSFSPQASSVINMTRAELERKRGDPTKCGRTIRAISGYEDNGEARYTVLYNNVNICGQPRFDLSAAEFWVHHANNTGTPDCRWRLDSLDAYTMGGEVQFAAVWVGDIDCPTEQVIRLDMTMEELEEELDRQLERGFKLQLLSGYADGDIARYAGMWEYDY